MINKTLAFFLNFVAHQIIIERQQFYFHAFLFWVMKNLYHTINWAATYTMFYK